jgi:hypothetical protein
MIQKLGEKLALASVSLAMVGLIFYWQLGGREHLAAILPSRSPSASLDAAPFIAIFGALLGRFIAKTKEPNQPPEATPGSGPQLPPSPSSGAPQL